MLWARVNFRLLLCGWQWPVTTLCHRNKLKNPLSQSIQLLLHKMSGFLKEIILCQINWPGLVKKATRGLLSSGLDTWAEVR